MIIDKETKLDNLALVIELNKKDSEFLKGISEVYSEIKPLLNTRIPSIFSKYTLHDTGHSFRIMKYMAKIVKALSQLNELEIALLIYAALLHDIGMAVSKAQIEAIKSDNFEHSDVRFSTMKRLLNNSEDEALQEYVRRIHGKLSAVYILENEIHFSIPGHNTLSFAKELALICESHVEDIDWVRRNLSTYEVRGDYSFNPQYIAAILRLSDILDIDTNRTPYKLYKAIAPSGHGDEEWKQHFIISNNDKIQQDENTQQKKVIFHGKSKNPSIHRKLLNYIGWVEHEIQAVTALTSPMQPQYRLAFIIKPEVNIQPEGYSFSDYKMTLNFNAISSLLMGEKIYGSKTLGLRELIQNSIDACKLRQEKEHSSYEFGEELYKPKIKLIFDTKKQQVVIKDNGCGMSLDVLKKHFLNIGVSYYKSQDFLLKDFQYKPIGNFGIGFLSCFMLSNNVSVTTRHYESKYKYTVELEKGIEYTSLTETEDIRFEGTEVSLKYEDFMSAFNHSVKQVHQFLTTYFLTDECELQLIEKDSGLLTPVKNSIEYLNELTANTFVIKLEKYLESVEGYAVIKTKHTFIKEFKDLQFEGNLYTYDPELGLEKVVDFASLKIAHYVVNQKIKYLSIPLVPYELEDDFHTLLKFTNDNVEEVIEKLDRDLEWISILPPPGFYDFLEENLIWDFDDVLDGLSFEHLVELGHSRDCKTKKYVKTIEIFEGRKDELYMPYDVSEDTWPSLYYATSAKRKLYIRNVLIKDYHFNIPVSSAVFEIEHLKVNIKSRKFVPDISRNNLDDNETSIINYMIGKAIQRGACDVMDITPDEKQTLQAFIEYQYDQESELERQKE